MGYVVLFLLSGLSAVAAAAVAARFYDEGRGARTLATLTVWLGIVVGPIHLLGWFDWLDRPRLAAASVVTSLVVLGLTVRGGVKARLRDAGKVLVELVRTPVDAFRLVLGERSYIAIALGLAFALVAWAALLCWLLPSGAWDGLTYHEPIVYYAIQNRGFSLVDVPATPISQQINSAPRVGHYLSLWFVFFTDRRLVEFPSVLMAVYLLVAFYQVARRFTAPAASMGYAIGLLLVPAILLQLRSTLQDSAFTAVFTMAAHYATKPKLRPRDVWIAALSIGLMGGYKFTGFVLVPLYGAVLLFRVLLGAFRERRFGSWLVPLAGGLAVVLSLALPTYVRNWTAFDNPVWPRHFAFESIGVEFKGIFQPYHRKSVDETVRAIYGPPVVSRQFADTRDNGFGIGAPFVVFPLAIVAWFRLGAELLLARIRRRPAPSAETWSLLLLALPAFLTLPLSPSFHIARYTVYALVAAWALVVWLLRGKQVQAFTHAVLGVLLATGLVFFHWSKPAWGAGLGETVRFARMNTREREEIRQDGSFNLDGPMARKRAREITAGDVVAYTYGDFIANLWNEELSSRVEHVTWKGNAKKFLERLDALRAEWVYVHKGTGPARALTSAAETWENIGAALPAHRHGYVYRRKIRR